MTELALTFPHLPPDDPANTPCPTCQQLHIMSAGHPSCIAHAKTRDGAPCGQPRMGGQRVCRKHGGKAKAAQQAARRRIALEQVKQELDSLGGSLEVDPAEALVAMVRKAAWNVAYLETRLSPGTPVEGGGDDEDADAPTAVRLTTWSEGGGLRPHPVMVLYNEERDRLARYAKLALDAGVSERLVRLAEGQGREVIRLVEAAFDMLGLSVEQRVAVPGVMGRLLELSSGEG